MPHHTPQPHATTRPTRNGMRIECETHIDAPPAFVWELIQEPTRRVEWDARLTSCALLTPRPLGKGARVRPAYGLLGWVEIEYTSWQPSLRSAVKTTRVSRGNVIASLVASWNFQPCADCLNLNLNVNVNANASSTTWKTQVVIRGAGGRLAPLVERVLIGPLMGWLTGRSARNLKRLAEREYAALREGSLAA